MAVIYVSLQVLAFNTRWKLETDDIRIEACGSRNLLVFEKVLMSFSGNRSSELKYWIIVKDAPIHVDVSMRRNGRNRQKEWTVGLNSFIEKIVCLLSKHVCHIIALITFWGLPSKPECTIEIVVGVWVEQKILFMVRNSCGGRVGLIYYRCCEASSIWRVVVIYCMDIEKLPGIVSVVPRFL